MKRVFEFDSWGSSLGVSPIVGYEVWEMGRIMECMSYE